MMVLRHTQTFRNPKGIIFNRRSSFYEADMHNVTHDWRFTSYIFLKSQRIIHMHMLWTQKQSMQHAQYMWILVRMRPQIR